MSPRGGPPPGLGPVFAYEWLIASRRWQGYALRSAFVLFLLAALLSGEAVLPQAKNTDIYLAGLGILLTTVYLYGLIFRPKRQILHMGIDSLVVLVLYLVGIAGLFAITLLS